MVDATDMLTRLSDMRGESIQACLASITEFAPDMQPETLPTVHRVMRWEEVEPVLAKLPPMSEIESKCMVQAYVAITIKWPGTIYTIAADRSDRGFTVAGVYCWPGENVPTDRIQPFYIGEWKGSAFLITYTDYEKAERALERKQSSQEWAHPFDVTGAVWGTDGIVARGPVGVVR